MGSTTFTKRVFEGNTNYGYFFFFKNLVNYVINVFIKFDLIG